MEDVATFSIGLAKLPDRCDIDGKYIRLRENDEVDVNQMLPLVRSFALSIG
jgi:hypothetical protein